MFYFVLGDQVNKSKLNSIFLLGITYSNNIKRYGMDAILEPIVSDLKALEGTIKNDKGEDISACLIAFTGDNLGMHAVAGFKEGFTAYRPCRFCMVTNTELHTLTFIHHDCVLRNKTLHKEHVQELLESDKPSDISKLYGINRDSVLNSLEYFHVTTGTPPDIMHDGLEGYLPTEIKHLLNQICFVDKIIPLSTVNSKIQQFDYGYSEKTKIPSEIKEVHLSKNGRLRQTASQMWSLSTLLPLMIGSLIPENNKYWENYIRLLLINNLIMSRNVSIKIINFLPYLISEYLEKYLTLYDTHLIPKQHTLTHYPEQLYRFGPLIDF
jgi:hypothetical protein